ncbi:hypothetical protein TRFO_42494 [Tritrichomonas foetus]|uniref:DML1/Misato tubulin domain-containing protein n=1 Tax=Tritrichomonas foetus TaxID=1144522 RepID=A0A1J4L0N5_9EUKA|nr:hypothetical protein TRFO_42494 [Tritrichomonas foetus]|eukprot:OHT15429.1 hypothetical protein TRFO_42494 [Tritrichomonas foetus]
MSTVFLSFGPTSGFLTGHCLNSLVECMDLPPTWFSESRNGLLPNAVFIDNAKSVHLYEEYELPDETTEKSMKIEKIDPQADSPIKIPRFKPTPFIEYIKKGGQTIIPLDKPRPNFKLDDCDIAWCDIVNFNLSRKSFVEIPGTDIEPLQTYMSGIEKASDSELFDELTEPIRRSLETCDSVANYIITIDRNSGYGGVFSKIAEYLEEETPKAMKISYSIAEEINSEAVACTASLSLSTSLNHSNLHTVLTLPEKLSPIFDMAKFSARNQYHTTALFSLPFTASILPILTNKVTGRAVVDIVAPTSILKLASLSCALPYYDPMTDYSFKTEERIYSRFTMTNGVPNDISNRLIEDDLRPGSPFFYDGAGQNQPVFVGLTMPHYFADNYVTNTGDRPIQRPAGLSDADYARLVQFGVVKVKEPVECARIRTLSTVSTFSTSKSLVEPLMNCVDFLKRSPRITNEISNDDAQAATEIVLNIVDGLREP